MLAKRVFVLGKVARCALPGALRARAWMLASSLSLILLTVALPFAQVARADDPHVPIVEPFTSTTLQDAALTTANWSTEAEELTLAWRQSRSAFGPSTLSRTISTDTANTISVAAGDMDGDGDLDLIAGNSTAPNRLYLNNGTNDPFNDVSGTNISSDSYETKAVAVEDMDGDGDLDLVVGNYGQPNLLYLNNGTNDPFNEVGGTNITNDTYSTFRIALRDMDGDGDLDLLTATDVHGRHLYLNNGTADPFSGVSGTAIGGSTANTLSLAVGDMDGDGDLDFMNGSLSQPNRLYLNNGTPDPFNGVSGTNITSDAHETASLAVGDMDGDGDLDLVVGNLNQANRLYLNNGTNDPFNGVSGTNITGDAFYTFSVAVGDVDGDGDLDVVASDMGHQIRLYRNNGTGAPFNGISAIDITSDADSTNSVIMADMDGDSDLDIVAGNGGTANRLYLNNGTGDPFSGVTGMYVTFDMNATKVVAVGDMDGDGDRDLVAGTDGVSRLYLSNGTSAPFDGVSGTNITDDTNAARALAVGDVDGDGDLDLVVGNSDMPSRLYLNNGTSAPFNGVSGTYITLLSFGTRGVALGDMDGDGDLDLVVGNEGELNLLYLNNGTSDPFNGVSGGEITDDTHSTTSIALGDLDRDGDLDLVTGNYSESNRYYLNNGTGDPFTGVTGIVFAFGEEGTNGVAVADMDGDGDLDVLNGNALHADQLYMNNGTSNPFQSIYPISIANAADHTTSVAVGDMDGDGDLDYITGNFQQLNRLYLNNGTSDPFNGVSATAIGSDILDVYSVALGDMDGDGDLDFVAANDGTFTRLHLNQRSPASFVGVSGSDITSDGDNTQALAVGDVDGDGDPDLVAGNSVAPNRLYQNNGTNDPFEAVTSTTIDNDSHNTVAVALGDVDRDGDLDLVAGNDGQPNLLYLNNGTADPFSGTIASDISSSAFDTRSLALGDVDGDGDLDLVVGNFEDSSLLYFNDGTGTYATSIAFTGSFNSIRSVALGEINGDGKLDLVTGADGEPNRLYLNNGTGDPFSGASNITSATDATYAVALGDMDGDGDLDLVVANYGQPNRLYLNNGTADPFSDANASDITTDTNATQSAALADVDGDSDLDLVTGNSGESNRLYLNGGTGSPFAGVIGTNITSDVDDTTALALADMDGDNALDLMIGNNGAVNRLYRRHLFDTSRGQAGSLRIDDETTNIQTARIAHLASLPLHTRITYWLSNNGGVKWYQVRPEHYFTFPTTGMDLRWRAELASSSPILAPRIGELKILVNQPPLADAGDDQNLTVGGTVTLDGRGSSDPDGDPLSFGWTQTSGPAVSFSATLSSTTFTAPMSPAVLGFSLIVIDAFDLASVADTTVITLTDSSITGLSADATSPTALNSSTQLTATASGTNIVYTWDFGDGSVASGATQGHTYAALGSYTAIVTATNSINVMTDTTSITIVDASIAGLNATNNGPSPLGAPTQLGASVTTGTNVTYTWNFGDGGMASGPTPTHAYPAIGSFTALVTATNGSGVVTDTTVVTVVDIPIPGLNAINFGPSIFGSPTFFQANTTGGTNVVYTWNFGDGSSVASGPTPNHTYTAVGSYTALVTATNTSSVVTDTTVVTVNDEVIKGLSATNNGPSVLGTPTLFGASVTAGTNVTYTWNFGDGSGVASGATPSHTYSNAGNYTAVVTATNGSSMVTKTTAVTVVDIPILGLNAINLSPSVLGTPTLFVATITAGSNALYTWNFGDGGTGNGATPNHIYSAVGSYTAVVSATNGSGVVTKTTQVMVVDTPVSAVIASSDGPTLLGNATHFTATATGSNILYIWEFGDGVRVEGGANATHSYGAAGVYEVEVTAYNGADAETVVISVTVSAPESLLPPQAVNDLAVTLAGAAVNISVLGNDSDPQASPLTLMTVAQPAHGAATLAANGTVTYTPAAEFVGVDQFSYTIVNAGNVTASAQVFVVVEAQTANGEQPTAIVTTPGVTTTHPFQAGDFAFSLQVPGDAYSGTLGADDLFYMVFSPVLSTTVDVDDAPGDFLFAGMLFSLNGYLNSGQLIGQQFAAPLLLEIEYPASALVGLDPDELTLFYHDEESDSWAGNGIEVVQHDIENHTITFAIHHLTTFGLFSLPLPVQEETNQIFMPILSNNKAE